MHWLSGHRMRERLSGRLHLWTHRTRQGQTANQLYIDPDECIDCGACEPGCPWQAIYEEPAVPELFQSDAALNRRTVESPEKFRVKTFEEKPAPTPQEIEENKRKWGLK
jgi:NAD-dependent dihydropyrimidine dehydrogenase PreA subunit